MGILISGRVRPSKPASIMAMIVGSVMIAVVMSVAGAGGGFIGMWMLLALGIVGYHAFNVFSKAGVAHHVVEFDSPMGSNAEGQSERSARDRLAALERLRQEDLVTATEYEDQRARILEEL